MSKPLEPFTTLCFSCRSPFDVLPAAFCSCTGGDRTPVCPTCRKCFCSAPAGYKQGFWITAPAPVWKRRTELLGEQIQRR